MFTGIVTSIGIFRGYRKGRSELLVEAPQEAPKLEPGASLAVDGVCLTVVRRDGSGLLFDLSKETLERTTLGGLRTGDRLNLERPLTPASLLSGHFVAGHVDGVAKVLRVVPRRPGKRLTIGFPPELRRYIVPKGSVAANGVSLTVADLEKETFAVELIPATLEGTNLGRLRPGDRVNLECDMLGKYVYNWVVTGANGARRDEKS
jgi:riboflavin synthase